MYTMKLIVLEPTFVKILSPTMYKEDVQLSNADGLRFLCPKCYNDSIIGVHSIIAWFEHVSLLHTPGPGRWKVSGNDFTDLTLEPSIYLIGHWHGFIKNGEIIHA